jgi:hypothetical protein
VYEHIHAHVHMPLSWTWNTPEIHMLFLFCFVFFRQSVTMWHRQAWNSQSSCLSLLSAWDYRPVPLHQAHCFFS